MFSSKLIILNNEYESFKYRVVEVEENCKKKSDFFPYAKLISVH